MSGVPPALACRGLVKRYGDLTAVDGLDLTVEQGECFGLLGPNGAGKTTTVEILEGLLPATAGEVEVLGGTWARDEARLRPRIGITLQETHFPDKAKVREVLELFRSFYPSGPAPGHAMEVVALTEKAESYVKDLSGGQRQRLSVACALVGEPEVLFLDEPTTGLDPQSRRAIWDVVGRFRTDGGTVLLTTHYMEEAERLCDRVAIVDRGRVIALGTPARLVAELGADDVVELNCGELPSAELIAALAALPGVRAARASGATLRLTAVDLHRVLPAILDVLRGSRTTFDDLRTHHPTLEDVFVARTGRHLRDG